MKNTDCQSASQIAATTQPLILRERFRKFAGQAAAGVGSPGAFVFACLLLMAWLVSGPLFHFSDTWQLIINTATTIVTFLMVFLIQSTQNRDAKAIHLKLDELIRSVKGARNHLVCLENLSDEELAELEKEFARLHEVSRKQPKTNGQSHPSAAAPSPDFSNSPSQTDRR